MSVMPILVTIPKLDWENMPLHLVSIFLPKRRSGLTRMMVQIRMEMPAKYYFPEEPPCPS